MSGYSGDDNGDGENTGAGSDDDTDNIDDTDHIDNVDNIDSEHGAGADLPADVEASLTQLLANAAADARRRDVDTVLAIVDTVETVSKNKVPDDLLRGRLLHGCRTVERLVADEPLVAAEYLEAMERLVDSA